MAVLTPLPPRPAPARALPRRLSRTTVLVADVVFGLVLLAIAFAGRVNGSPPASAVQTEPAQIVTRLDGIMQPGESTGLAVASDGSLAVVDRGRSVIVRLDANGQPLGEWGPSFGPGLDASDLAGITPDGDGWAVLDRGAQRIMRLDARGHGQLDRTIDLAQVGTYGPNGLASDGQGNLFMADTGRDRLVMFDSSGEISGTLGDPGTDLGKLRQPMFLAFAPDGGFFVTDWGNSRVEHFDANRHATTSWTLAVAAWGIAVDSAGRVYVPDGDHRAVSIFDSDGAFLGQVGSGPGSEAPIDATSQLAVSPDGARLWVLGDNSLTAFDLAPYANLQPQPIAEPVKVPLAVLGGALLLVAATSVVWTPRGHLPVRPPELAAAPPPARARRAPASAGFSFSRHWPSSSRQLGIEAACLVLIVGVALFLRAHDLDSLPHGMHGDEADSGLEGLRILHQGWIGLYSPLALGRPTGPLYLTAITVALMGNTILAVRMIPMIMGVLTVLALYFVVRRNGSAPLALMTAGVLAVMNWHIHISRIAFHPATWGLVVVLAAGALLEATRGRHWWWWLVGGTLAGAGVYFYQAAWLALAVFGVFVGLFVVTTWLLDNDRRTSVVAATACAAGVVIAILPMSLWAADPNNGYFNSFNLEASLNKPAFLQLAGGLERAAYLAGRYGSFWDGVCCHPRLDSIDGTGQVPIVPLLQLGIAGIGMVAAVRWWRHPLALLSIVFVFLAPVGAILTLGGDARRVFELVPFLAICTALGAYTMLRPAFQFGLPARAAAVGMVALLFGVVAYQNVNAYFGVFANSGADRWVFAQELTDAASYMAALPNGTHVYFYSDRWGVQYETARFLAPNASAEDRSREFSPAHVTDTSLTTQPAVFILIGQYRGLLVQLQSEYPGGETTYGGAHDDPTFIAYAPAANHA
jgi:4-amino-4-deoxy-L-arabinose transferase-like glycosyltransferase